MSTHPGGSPGSLVPHAAGHSPQSLTPQLGPRTTQSLDLYWAVLYGSSGHTQPLNLNKAKHTAPQHTSHICGHTWRAAAGLVSLVPEGSVPDKDMGPMSPQLIERSLTKTASTPRDAQFHGTGRSCHILVCTLGQRSHSCPNTCKSMTCPHWKTRVQNTDYLAMPTMARDNYEYLSGLSPVLTVKY